MTIDWCVSADDNGKGRRVGEGGGGGEAGGGDKGKGGKEVGRKRRW